MGSDEPRKSVQAGRLVVGEDIQDSPIVLGQRLRAVKRKRSGRCRLDVESCRFHDVEQGLGRLQQRRLERLRQRVLDARFLAREQRGAEAVVTGQLGELAPAQAREQRIVVRAHGQHQPVGQNPRAHLLPRQPAQQLRLEALLDRFLRHHQLVQRIQHRFCPAQHYRPEPLRPPRSTPDHQQLHLPLPLRPCPRPSPHVVIVVVVAEVMIVVVVEGVNRRPRPLRRQHRARLVVRHRQRERLP